MDPTPAPFQPFLQVHVPVEEGSEGEKNILLFLLGSDRLQHIEDNVTWMRIQQELTKIYKN